MPPIPTFDSYAELQVAMLQLVIACYHRLARIHHRDRNHGNEEKATIDFQRLQQAYETLSSLASRVQYDIRQRTVLQPFVKNKDTDTDKKNDHEDEFSDSEFSTGDFGFSHYFWTLAQVFCASQILTSTAKLSLSTPVPAPVPTPRRIQATLASIQTS